MGEVLELALEVFGFTLHCENYLSILGVGRESSADSASRWSAFETMVSQWPGVVTVGVFAHQKAQVCLLGTANGVKVLTF